MGPKRSWEEELAIVDRTMRAISSVSDPEELVDVYWDNIRELMPFPDYIAVSRRHVETPYYLVTRSSRFTEQYNPWTQRHRLPKLSGGLLGEIAYANGPVMIDDLPSRLAADDPAWVYLEGFGSLVALPQYDGGEGLNVTMLLLKPGEVLDRATIPMLHWQSGLFGRGTQNLVLRNQLGAALAALDAELKVVGEIQRSLLPAELPIAPGVELSAWYETSARAGGDYYDVFPLPGGRLGLFIADVSGHGTPAAVLMAIIRAIAHANPGVHGCPVEFLRYLNAHLTKSYTHGGAFVTAFYGVLDPETETLVHASAGHHPPRLLRDGRVLGLSSEGGLPLGVLEDQAYTQGRSRVGRGDLLVLYTDGVTEAMSPVRGGGARELYGTPRLDAVLVGCAGVAAEACLGRVRESVARFCEGGAATDDRTLLAVRLH